MPTHVHGLLDRMVALEALMVKLDQSNEQLVRLVSEQHTEIRGLRDGMRLAAGGPTPDNVRPPSVTLLAGNSLLCDVNEDTSAGGNDKIIVRRKTGAAPTTST